jgi:outer membrane murein-binding lipoprotein Lpp
MKDKSLLNELDAKVRQLVATIERERAKNSESVLAVKESRKVNKIETKIKSLVSLIEQLEKS